MQVIIPMAGSGQRFVDQGYSNPKPLIEVNGKKILDYIVDSYSKDDEYLFICNDEHLENTDLRKVVDSYNLNSRLVSIPRHKLGPVYTVLQVEELIQKDSEVIVSYCDNPFIWHRRDFESHIKSHNLDGCIISHSGFHPHTLNKTKMAFLKVKNNLVCEVKEKESYTNNPMSEHASTGAYYFKKGTYVRDFFNKCIEENLTYNNEYYVTLTYNLMIKEGLRIGYYDTPFATVMGTPEEVSNMVSWHNIINKGQVKTESDLIKCFRYWKEYYRQTELCI